MSYSDIQTDYKYFNEHISSAHSILGDLCPRINQFLQICCRAENYDEDFAYRLELVSFSMERVLFELDNLIDAIDNISLPQMKICKKEEKIKTNPWEEVLLFYPRDYDEDIYVDSSYRIDWKTIIEGSNKPKFPFKLYRNNKGIK